MAEIVTVKVQGTDKFVRLHDSLNLEERIALKKKYAATEDGGSDDFLAQLALFTFTISPQYGLWTILHYYKQAIQAHVSEFAALLLRRFRADNCSQKLKAVLAPVDFAQFLLPLAEASPLQSVGLKALGVSEVENCAQALTDDIKHFFEAELSPAGTMTEKSPEGRTKFLSYFHRFI